MYRCHNFFVCLKLKVQRNCIFKHKKLNLILDREPGVMLVSFSGQWKPIPQLIVTASDERDISVY